jgi:hypothetical protein
MMATQKSNTYDAEDEEESGSFAGQLSKGFSCLSRRIYEFMSCFKQSGGIRKNE